MKTLLLKGRTVYGGRAEGEALVTTESVGGYGAFDVNTGEVIEANHAFLGKSIADKILVFKGAKGSSSWSTWHQALRFTGKAPRAYVVQKSNSQIALGAVVLRIPAITDLDQDPTVVIATGDWVRVNGDNGTVEVIRRRE